MPSATHLCPKCSGEVLDGWRVCPACAAPLEAETEFFASSTSSSPDEGRFPVGTVLAGRYRILGLIGHGGMGEVHRAYDLILNQAVALKFLTAVELNEAALARFRNEVRIARQVSHPNVCRVYDISFVEGLHFLSMEYLDGEDLSSLLRRIGRLPQDKAIEFTRKICAGLAAAIERVILRCLEEDPKRRPASALSVAMALPGGDPMAAALAAGETPSPEMVAASGEKEGFSPRVATICFATILVLLAAATILMGRVSLLNKAPLEIPPDGLAFRAQDILKQLGYAEKPKSTAYGFTCCDMVALRSLDRYDIAHRDALLASHQPAVIRFWYRQHQSEFQADAFFGYGAVKYDSPANIQPNMIRLALDARGRLIAFEARPPDSRGQPSPDKAADWGKLFTAAGLDPARFAPTTPLEVPPMAFDAQTAWMGTYAEGRPEQIRVEAASWQGRPVFFDIRGDWSREGGPSNPKQPPAFVVLQISLFAFALVGASVVARRNLRLGRGDRQGAARLAGFLFLVGTCTWAALASHTATPWELGLLVMALSSAAFFSALGWLGYIAIEPYVRRHWPDSLISWTRVQAGRVRDPLVASHVLVAILVELGLATVALVLIPISGSGRPLFLPAPIDSLNSTSYLLAALLGFVGQLLIATIAILLVLVLLRLLVRRVWISEVLGALLLGSLLTGPWDKLYAADVVYGISLVYLVLWLVRRFGLLVPLVLLITSQILFLPVSLTSWYAGHSLVALLIPASLAAWALWVILSAQRRPATESAGAA